MASIVTMRDEQKLCPYCGKPMKESLDRREPPEFTPDEAGTVLTRLECTNCGHAEGRHPKGDDAWKNAQGD